jgi:hypothetical protein
MSTAARVLEPVHVPDLGPTMTAASIGPMPGQPLDHLVAAVTGEQFRDHLGQHGDLGSQLAGQVPQRGDFADIRLGQAQPIQPCRPGRAEDVRARHRTPSLASTPWTRSLQLVGRLASLCR